MQQRDALSVGKLLYYEVRREGPEAVEGELGCVKNHS